MINIQAREAGSLMRMMVDDQSWYTAVIDLALGSVATGTAVSRVSLPVFLDQIMAYKKYVPPTTF